jgi:hypothetical protein
MKIPCGIEAFSRFESKVNHIHPRDAADCSLNLYSENDIARHGYLLCSNYIYCIGHCAEYSRDIFKLIKNLDH